MIKDDVELSVAIDILNRKISKLNIKIVENPNNSELKNKLNYFLDIKKEISKGNAELIKKVIDEAKNS